MNKFNIHLSSFILGSALISCSLQKDEQKPNILLFVADDIAPEQFSFEGGGIPTPNIDRLAQEGMIFKNAFAVSAACTPSRYSILTGQFPGRCNDKGFLSKNPVDQPYLIAWNTPVTEQNVCIHELMKEAGYYTAFVGKFHVGNLEYSKADKNPLLPYIDPDSDPRSPVCDSLLHLHQEVLKNRVKELTGAEYASSIQWENPEQMPVKKISCHNLEWLTWGVKRFFEERDESRPFFLHFNTSALHGPNHFNCLYEDFHFTPEGIMTDTDNLHPSRNSIFKRLVEMGIDTSTQIADHIRHYYSGKIYLDDQVGIILELLKKYDLEKNTILILTSDHAIEPGKSTCYHSGLKVPFIVRWPNIVEAGSQTNVPIQFTDFFPTFLDIAEAKLPENLNTDGTSFLPLIKGQNSLERKYIYGEEGYTRSVYDGRYKYIAMRFPDQVIDSISSGKADIITHFGAVFQAHGLIASKHLPGYFDADQLYDLENDPLELHNLAYDPEYTELLNELKSQLSSYLQSFDHPFKLEDNNYNDTEAYRKLVSKTREKGTSVIPWWNRGEEYPEIIR